MSDQRCGEPLGASYWTGVVLCVLPAGHEGDHDGGEAERQLGAALAAQMVEDRE